MIITHFNSNNTISIDNFFDFAKEDAIPDILEMECEAYTPFLEKFVTSDFTADDCAILSHCLAKHGRGLHSCGEGQFEFLSQALFWCNAHIAVMAMRTGEAEPEDRKLADTALQLAEAHLYAEIYFDKYEKSYVAAARALFPENHAAFALIEARSKYFVSTDCDEELEAMNERQRSVSHNTLSSAAFMENTEIILQEIQDGEEYLSDEAAASKKRFNEDFLPQMKSDFYKVRRMRILDKKRLKSSRQSFSIRRCRSRTHRVIIRAARSGQGTDSATDDGGGSEPPDQRHKRPP